MKKINKQNSPVWFETWKNDFENTEGRKPHYKNDFSTDNADGSNRRIRLRSHLVAEQGYICCYCMNAITADSSHIEHFWPKETFRDIDLEYTNLLASCNGEGTIIFDEEHCGHKKENWWHEDMVSPVDMKIENMFKYSIDGKIHSIRGQEDANIADIMIHNLGLNSFHLERNRRQAIEASEVCEEEDYSEEDIRDFIDYYSNMDNGKYVPYCQAIVDCLKDLL